MSKPLLTPTRVAVLAGTGYILKKLHDEIKRKERDPTSTDEDVARAKQKATRAHLDLGAVAGGLVR